MQKWPFVALFVLGVVLAGAAAILVVGVRALPVATQVAEPAPATTNVVVAATSMPALSVVGSDAVLIKAVAKAQVPPGCISDPIAVVGKVLMLPMVEGQPFLSGCFAKEGSGTQLAAVLPKGMRAVSISLPDQLAVGGLLYPGCLVDVLVSFKMSADQGDLEAISSMLLQGLEVWAVDDRTVVSTSKSGIDEPAAHASGRSRIVTLLVNGSQAETLQLAMEHGTMSLALRNPTDVATGTKEGTFLTDLSVTLAKRLKTKREQEMLAAKEDLAAEVAKLKDKALAELAAARAKASAQASDPPKAGSPAMAPPPTPPEQPTWKMTLIRGDTVEEVTVPMPPGIKRQ